MDVALIIRSHNDALSLALCKERKICRNGKQKSLTAVKYQPLVTAIVSIDWATMCYQIAVIEMMIHRTIIVIIRGHSRLSRPAPSGERGVFVISWRLPPGFRFRRLLLLVHGLLYL